jgi:hypothetical protein
MKQMLIKLIKQIVGLFPSALPNGVAAFDVWAKDIMDTYDLPTKDEDSVKFTLATIIMHLGPQVAYKPKVYFVLTLKAGAAKQVASQVFTDIKTKAKEAELAAQKAANDNGQPQA